MKDMAQNEPEDKLLTSKRIDRTLAQSELLRKENQALRELLDSIRVGLSTSGTQLNQLANELDKAKADPVAYMERTRRIQAQQMQEQQKMIDSGNSKA